MGFSVVLIIVDFALLHFFCLVTQLAKPQKQWAIAVVCVVLAIYSGGASSEGLFAEKFESKKGSQDLLCPIFWSICAAHFAL